MLKRSVVTVLCCLSIVSTVRPDGVSNQIERTIYELSNQSRQQNGAPMLAYDEKLAAAAREHSADMAELDFFDHTNPKPNKARPWDRVVQKGVDPRRVAENIYWAKGHPQSKIATLAVSEWMESPGHRQNLLEPRNGRVGIGVSYKNKAFWITQDFSD